MTMQERLTQFKQSENVNELRITAWAMMNPNSRERREAEKMMGARFEDMTQAQRRLAAAALTAFKGIW